jgi:hypothetical protein
LFLNQFNGSLISLRRLVRDFEIALSQFNATGTFTCPTNMYGFLSRIGIANLSPPTKRVHKTPLTPLAGKLRKLSPRLLRCMETDVCILSIF